MTDLVVPRRLPYVPGHGSARDAFLDEATHDAGRAFPHRALLSSGLWADRQDNPPSAPTAHRASRSEEAADEASSSHPYGGARPSRTADSTHFTATRRNSDAVTEEPSRRTSDEASDAATSAARARVQRRLHYIPAPFQLSMVAAERGHDAGGIRERFSGIERTLVSSDRVAGVAATAAITPSSGLQPIPSHRYEDLSAEGPSRRAVLPASTEAVVRYVEDLLMGRHATAAPRKTASAAATVRVDDVGVVGATNVSAAACTPAAATDDERSKADDVAAVRPSTERGGGGGGGGGDTSSHLLLLAPPDASPIGPSAHMATCQRDSAAVADASAVHGHDECHDGNDDDDDDDTPTRRRNDSASNSAIERSIGGTPKAGAAIRSPLDSAHLVATPARILSGEVTNDDENRRYDGDIGNDVGSIGAASSSVRPAASGGTDRDVHRHQRAVAVFHVAGHFSSQLQRIEQHLATIAAAATCTGAARPPPPGASYGDATSRDDDVRGAPPNVDIPPAASSASAASGSPPQICEAKEEGATCRHEANPAAGGGRSDEVHQRANHEDPDAWQASLSRLEQRVVTLLERNAVDSRDREVRLEEEQRLQQRERQNEADRLLAVTQTNCGALESRRVALQAEVAELEQCKVTLERRHTEFSTSVCHREEDAERLSCQCAALLALRDALLRHVSDLHGSPAAFVSPSRVVRSHSITE